MGAMYEAVAREGSRMSLPFRTAAFAGQDSRHQEGLAATVAFDLAILARIADRGIVMMVSAVCLVLGHLEEVRTDFVEAAEIADCLDDWEVAGGNQVGAHLCPY